MIYRITREDARRFENWPELFLEPSSTKVMRSNLVEHEANEA